MEWMASSDVAPACPSGGAVAGDDAGGLPDARDGAPGAVSWPRAEDPGRSGVREAGRYALEVGREDEARTEACCVMNVEDGACSFDGMRGKEDAFLEDRGS